MKITVTYINYRLPGAGFSGTAEITAQDAARSAAILAAATMLSPAPALAAGTDIAGKVANASQPIKALLLGVADPVCYIVFCWGLLEAMLGKGASGVQRMKYATLGFVGLNWLPVFMEILRQAKP